jgi:hypothetical protein
MVFPCPSHFSSDHDDGTKTKLAHFHRMSNDDPLDKAESMITPSVRQNLFNCFAFLRPRRSEKYAEQIRRQNLERRTPTPSIIPALSFVKMASQVDAAPYAWPISGGMNPNTTALVIIDMQKDCKYHLPIFLFRTMIRGSSWVRMITCIYTGHFLEFIPLTNMSNITSF